MSQTKCLQRCMHHTGGSSILLSEEQPPRNCHRASEAAHTGQLPQSTGGHKAICGAHTAYTFPVRHPCIPINISCLVCLLCLAHFGTQILQPRCKNQVPVFHIPSSTGCKLVMPDREVTCLQGLQGSAGSGDLMSSTESAPMQDQADSKAAANAEWPEELLSTGSAGCVLSDCCRVSHIMEWEFTFSVGHLIDNHSSRRG